MLYQLPLYDNMNKPQVYIYPLPLEPPSHIPIPLLQVITELSSLFYSSFPLTICFTHGTVYVSLFFPNLPICPTFLPPCVCMFTSESLFLPWKQAHLYHFSRLHIYVLIQDICFSLTSLSMTDSRFILVATQAIF